MKTNEDGIMWMICHTWLPSDAPAEQIPKMEDNGS